MTRGWVVRNTWRIRKCKKWTEGTSLVIQRLSLPSSAGDTGSILCQGIKIPPAVEQLSPCATAREACVYHSEGLAQPKSKKRRWTGESSCHWASASCYHAEFRLNGSETRTPHFLSPPARSKTMNFYPKKCSQFLNVTSYFRFFWKQYLVQTDYIFAFCLVCQPLVTNFWIVFGLIQIIKDQVR